MERTATRLIMKDTEIQERNEQIALMLSWYEENSIWKVLKPFRGGSIAEQKVKDLKFHSDWNWLMQAIQFLQKHFESKEMVWTTVQRYPLFTDIETVFTMVSDFAKHYNEGEL